MINTRPGFRPYPLHKNAIIKGVSMEKKVIASIKQSSGKSVTRIKDKQRNTPATDKSYKRNSMNYRKRKLDCYDNLQSW
jgi:hypothetical protein